MTVQPRGKTWREVLGELTLKPAEKQRVAEELGVRAYTLTRWVEGISDPRLHYLQQLPNLFPAHREHLYTLIEQEFPNVKTIAGGLDDFIPPSFYDQLLEAAANLEGDFSSWTIAEMGLQQLTRIIDKDGRTQPCITLFRCTPPSQPDGVVRSLHELASLNSLNEHTPGILYGASSLAAAAILSQRALSTDSLAVSIRRRRKSAGSLVVRLQQPITPVYRSVIERYARLFQLLFTDSEFYRDFAFEEFFQEKQQHLRERLGVVSPRASLAPSPEAYQQLEALFLAQEEEHKDVNPQ